MNVMAPSAAYWQVFIGSTLLMLLRYLLIAGTAYLLFYVWKRRSYLHKRIQAFFPKQADYRREVLYSLSTFLIFGVISVGVVMAQRAGYTQIYTNLADYGWGYFVLSILLTIVLHDAYFYWTHRLMHWRVLYRRVHNVHHLSTNPSPWSAFAFHPLEAVAEAGILPLIVFLMPIHPLAVFIFILYMTVMNVLGHLGFEVYPKGFTRSVLTGWNNTSTHHNMHHKYFKYNYGLYFNWWDKLMGTNHPQYHEKFDEIAVREPANEPQAAAVTAAPLDSK